MNYKGKPHISIGKTILIKAQHRQIKKGKTERKEIEIIMERTNKMPG